jgi:hypothetical protein
MPNFLKTGYFILEPVRFTDLFMVSLDQEKNIKTGK